MNQYLCLRCLKASISVEGLHCYQCEKDESLKNAVTAILPTPTQKPGNKGNRQHAQVSKANKSAEDVRKYLCLRCLEVIKSVEGLHCYECDDDESLKNEATSILPTPTQKPGNKGHRQHAQVSKADKSAEDVRKYLCLRCLDVIKSNDGLHCYECDDPKEGFTILGESSQDIIHDSSVKHNPLPGTLNANRKDFHDKFPLSISKTDPETSGTMLETTDKLQLASPQTCLREQSSFDSNIPDSEDMFRRQGNMDPKQHANEAGELNSAGSSLSRSEVPALSFSQESSRNAKRKEKGNLVTSDLVSDRRRTRKRQHSPDLLSSPPKKCSLR